MYENTFSPPPTPPPPEVRHSKVGVASFILGIASLLFLCVGFLIAFGYGMSIGIQNPMNPQIDSSSPLILVASAVMCLAPLLSLVGLGLGIAGMLEKEAKKTLGVIGLALNGLILLAYCSLTLVGLLGGGGILGF